MSESISPIMVGHDDPATLKMRIHIVQSVRRITFDCDDVRCPCPGDEITSFVTGEPIEVVQLAHWAEEHCDKWQGDA